MTKIKGERRKWGEAEAKMRKGRGGWDTELEIDDEESRKAREKDEQENEGGSREKKWRKESLKSDEAGVGDSDMEWEEMLFQDRTYW